MLVGYARVSTLDQEHHLQFDALRKAGVKKIYSDKSSGVAARPQLQKLLAELKIGDQLVVYKLDRLARSLADLLRIIERLDAMGCDFKSLTEPIDTGSAAGRLMLQILGAVAEFERTLIRERSIAGQVAAVKRGVVLGTRKWTTTPEIVAEMKQLYSTGEFSYPDIAAFFNVHPSTAKRLITGRKNRASMPVLSKYL